MKPVTISPKFQVVIPKAIRQHLKLKPGQKLSVVVIGNVLRFFPVAKPATYRGIARGVEPSIERERDRIL